MKAIVLLTRSFTQIHTCVATTGALVSFPEIYIYAFYSLRVNMPVYMFIHASNGIKKKYMIVKQTL